MQVARTQHDIRLLCIPNKLRQARGIVREIGVHLDDVLRAALESVTKSRDVGRTEPHLARALDQMDPRLARHAGTHQITGAVRGTIIHYEHLEIERQRQHLIEQRSDVVPLVVRWNHHELFHYTPGVLSQYQTWPHSSRAQGGPDVAGDATVANRPLGARG